jgi:hypothetical protein
MNDTIDSFFNHNDFEWGKSEAGSHAELPKNRLALNIFQKDVTEKDFLSGFVALYIKRTLPRGSIMFFIETIQESQLPKLTGNSEASEELQKIKKAQRAKLARIRAQKKMKKAKQAVMPKKLSRVKTGAKRYKSNKKISNKFRKISSKMVMPNIRFLTNLRNARSGRHLSTNFRPIPIITRPQVVFEFKHERKPTFCKALKMFQFTSEVQFKEPLNLVLPFKVNLNSSLPCSQNYKFTSILNNFKYGKEKHSSYLHGLKNKEELKKSKEKIEVYNVVRAVFVTPEMLKKGKEFAELHKKFEAYEKEEEYMDDFHVVNIHKSQNLLKFDRSTKKTEFVVKELKSCCKIEQILSRCVIAFERTFVRSFEDHINFVVKFDKKLLTKFEWLDVVIISRLEITEEDSCKHFTDKVVLANTYNIKDKIPKGSGENESFEFVRKLELGSVKGILESLRTKYVSVEHRAEFYLSAEELGFGSQVMRQVLEFVKVEDLNQGYSVWKEKKDYERMADMIESDESALLLPHCNFMVSEGDDGIRYMKNLENEGEGDDGVVGEEDKFFK